MTRIDQDVLKCIDDYFINIKESNKGRAIIIKDTDFFKEKVLAHLYYEKYYKNDTTYNPENATEEF